MRRRAYSGQGGGVMASGFGAAATRRRVFESWGDAIEFALTRGYQTGWKHIVRRVPNTAVYRAERTGQRVRYRCRNRGRVTDGVRT